MRILAAPHGIALAHVTRPLEVAKRLRDRGDEVIFACSGHHARFITDSGFPCLSIVTEPPERALARVRNGKRFDDDDQLLESYVADELRIIRQVRPDLVLGDMRPTLGISTEMLGVPYVAIMNACFARCYSAPYEPPETWPITHMLGRRLGRWIVPIVQRIALRLLAAPIRHFRQKHGLRPVLDMFDVFESPFLNLLADVPEFAPTRNLPEHFRYIGPITWDPPVQLPPWFERLAPERTTIYVTLGSTGELGAVAESIAEGLSGLDAQVMLVGGGARPDRSRPHNFLTAPHAPGKLLAARADLVICHGGNGTIYQALGQGRPVLGLPTFIEQELHMNRVVALGLGIKLAPHRVSARSIRESCEAILREPAFRFRASAFARSLASWDGPALAAEAIHLAQQDGKASSRRTDTSNGCTARAFACAEPSTTPVLQEGA